MPSLLCVLITYYGLQKIRFGQRISKCFSCRNRVRQHAQSAVKIHLQKKPGSRACGHCNSPAASPKLQVIICMELKANMMLCLRGKHLTDLAVPSPELLITYCGVSFKANYSVNYDNKPMQARSRRTLWRRCWNTLCSQKCWRYCSSLGWLRTFCKNWFPTSQTCISPP